MKYEFTLPRSFNPADYLPLRLATRADDARWLISTIVRKTADRDLDEKGCVRLHSDVMRRVMWKKTQPAVIQALVEGGVIETTGHSRGLKAKGYRLAHRFLDDRCVRVPATDTRLIERIQAEYKRQRHEQRETWLPIHYLLNAQQQGLTITDDADGILDELIVPAKLCQSVLVDRIRRREYPFSVSRTGRCFNSITSLKRELRGTVRLDDQPMGCVDIVNAQPAMLAMLMHPDYPPTWLKSGATYKHGAPPFLPLAALALLPALDVSLFGALAAEGLLYESLVPSTGLSREDLKLSLLRDVLAKRGPYPSVVESAFRDTFPTVYRIIREVNRLDHGELIRLLQRAESWLVIEQVAPRLLRKMPIVTLHDAVFSQHRDVREVAAGFREVFEELGFTLGLKLEE